MMEMSYQDRSELISVILPVYNCERTIEEAVSSVLRQTYKNIELIIVDDASTDNTLQICRSLAEKDSRIRILTNQTNCGALESRFLGIGETGGDWIAFIDADDLWDHKKIEKQLALRDKTKCDLVFTASAFLDEKGEKYNWILHVPGEVTFKRLLKQNIISNSSVLVRKESYIKYSPDLKKAKDLAEDFACWLNMLRAGLTACGIDEPLITYRVTKGSRSGNKMIAARLNMNTYKCIGLGFFARIYYQACYAVNGIKKYSHIRLWG